MKNQDYLSDLKEGCSSSTLLRALELMVEVDNGELGPEHKNLFFGGVFAIGEPYHHLLDQLLELEEEGFIECIDQDDYTYQLHPPHRNPSPLNNEGIGERGFLYEHLFPKQTSDSASNDMTRNEPLTELNKAMNNSF